MNFIALGSLLFVLFIASLLSAAKAGSLEDDFHHPPPDASTWVYWVWLETPTTPAAITRDLEEMKAKGIAGFILYDTGAGGFLATGKMIPVDKGFKLVATHEYDGQYTTQLPRLAPWSPEWRKDIRYVAAEAKRLGLTFCLAHGLAGVSAPGLNPRYGQQELKWSQQDVEGPGNFDATLSLPALSATKPREPKSTSAFWDVAVLAVPIQDHAYGDPHLRYGKTFRIDPAETADIDIIIGDSSGFCCFFLLIQNMDDTYETTSDGTPKLPIFQIGSHPPPTFSAQEEHPPLSDEIEPWETAN